MFNHFKFFLFIVLCLSVVSAGSQPIPLDQKYIDSITPRLPGLPDDSAKVNNLVTIAAMYILVNPDLTLRYAREGVAIADKINYPVGKINCLGQTAFFYAVTGEWAKATADLNEPIPLCEKYSPKQLIYMYNLMYINAATKGDSLEALGYAQKALHHPAFLTLQAPGKWATYMQLGRSYENLNRLDSAIYYANILVVFTKKYGSVIPDLTSNTNTVIGSIAIRQKIIQRQLTISAPPQIFLD